ncbi:MAG: PfkB family carbohydrate kinase [Treponemataceae bacterium]|nr:PfkB family carbohydrate kinase [Treponemataceae bacterium]
MKNKLCIYGIGRAMTDCFFMVRENALLPSGMEWNGFSHKTGPAFDETLALLRSLSFDYCRKTGGSAANILKTAAHFGAECFFTGSVGNASGGGKQTGSRDETAMFFQKSMAQSKVNARLFLCPGNSGRFATVIGEDGRRSCLANPDAAARISASFIEESRIEQSDCTVIETFAFLPPEQAPGEDNRATLGARISEMCARHSKPLVINGSSVYAAAAFAPELAELAGRNKVFLFANEYEDAAMRKFVAPEEHAFLYVKTMASKGAECWTEGAHYHVDAVPPAEGILCDETGCGDTFCGAFIAAYFAGTKLEECLQIAAETATRSLCGPGCAF